MHYIKIGATMFRLALQRPAAPTKSVLLFANSLSLLWRDYAVKFYQIAKLSRCSYASHNTAASYVNCKSLTPQTLE
jgi:hypothetical protein